MVVYTGDLFCSVAEGVKLYNENQFKDALDYYKRAVNMDPKCAEAWYRASQV
jgi:tetratricopeptide (TPR) repeat protein